MKLLERDSLFLEKKRKLDKTLLLMYPLLSMDLPELLKVNVETLFKPQNEPAEPAEPALPVGPSSQQKKVRDVISYLDLYYHLNGGKYPTLKAICTETSVPEDEVLDLIEDEVNLLLKARGLPEFNCHLSQRGSLDPEFVAACSLVTDISDKRSLQAKLKLVGKTTAWWSALLKQRRHAEYYKQRVEEVWDGELRQKAKLGVARLIDRDDLSAIKYFHEYTGEFTPSQGQVIQLQLVIQMLMEILAKHVAPATLVVIAEEMEKSGVLGLPVGSNGHSSS